MGRAVLFVCFRNIDVALRDPRHFVFTATERGVTSPDGPLFPTRRARGASRVPPFTRVWSERRRRSGAALRGTAPRREKSPGGHRGPGLCAFGPSTPEAGHVHDRAHHR